MRIIYLHQYFKTPSQAGGTRSYEMAKRLVEWGHEVHIVTSWTSDTPRSKWFVEKIDGINVHWLPLKYNNHMGFYERLKAFFQFAFSAARRAANLQGDIIFASSTPLTIALPAVYAAHKSGCPMVFEVRDLWPHVPIEMGILKNPILIGLARLLEKFAYQQSTSLVALSQGMADGIVSAGFPASRITVIPNSADLELFDPASVLPGKFREIHPELTSGPLVLYPGTLGKVNGVGYIADLAAAVYKLRSDIGFVIVGDGVERAVLHAKAKNNGVLNKNLFIYEAMPKKELVYAFRDAAMIISTVIDLSALESNSANKVFDAMAAGKAIAINHGGWQKDIIEKNNLGLVLPRDISLAADILVKFFENNEMHERCGENSRRIAVSDYSRELLAKRLESVLLSALTSSRKIS
jgi:glycosyltransferase involved in cell wall biosynthesis